MNRPTITDVAKRAGVTGKTVSRHINRDGPVSAKTREKIEEAIAALQYRPNIAARSLKSAKSFLIAVFNNNPSPHYVADVIRGASQVCRKSGHYLTLEEFDVDDADCAAEIEKFLQSVPITGAILIPPLTDDEKILFLLEQYEVPFVRMSPATNIDRSDAIFADDAIGVQNLAEHLWSIGHRKIAIISGPDTHVASQIRRDAFISHLLQCGADPKSIILEKGDFSLTSGQEAGRRLMDMESRPTAIFASNDEMAAGVIAAVSNANLKIPDDIAVAGFDDSEVARLIWPPLTTIRQSITDQAKTALDLLLTQKTRAEPKSVQLPVELVVRRSTDAKK